MQRIKRIGGGSVVIRTRGSPIAQQQVQIHEPALYLSLAILDQFHHAFRKADGRQTRRARQTLLAAGVNRVDLTFINLERRAAQRGDGINNGEAIMAMRDFAQ